MEGVVGLQLEIATWDTECMGKEQAIKVLEEAAEVFSAWEAAFAWGVPKTESNPYFEVVHFEEIEPLADEIADVITAACNLARKYGCDMHAAMERCAERNRERGRL